MPQQPWHETSWQVCRIRPDVALIYQTLKRSCDANVCPTSKKLLGIHMFLRFSVDLQAPTKHPSPSNGRNIVPRSVMVGCPSTFASCHLLCPSRRRSPSPRPLRRTSHCAPRNLAPSESEGDQILGPRSTKWTYHNAPP